MPDEPAAAASEGTATLDPQFPTTADEQSVAPVAAEEGPESKAESDELEELILPSSIRAPEPLAPGTRLGPDERLSIGEHLGAAGRINRYRGAWKDEGDQDVPVEVRDGSADDASLAREAEVLGEVRYAMLQRCFASFAENDRRYVVLEQAAEGATLEEALRDGLRVEEVVALVLQLAQAVRRLQQAGWAPVGLAPSEVRLGQPLRLTQLGSAVRIGETPPQALHVAGYSAPELALPAAVSGKEVVYTLGAILYRALAGQPLPESGPELAALPRTVQVPGLPQVLAPALAPVEERIDLEELYRRLLVLKQRLAATPVGLEVASATTVGLNPTRTTNEDACGYLTWSAAGDEGLSTCALLCVADGMGGMEAGEVASQTALRTILGGAGERGSSSRTELPLESEGAANQGWDDLLPNPDPVALIRQAAPAVHAAGEGREMGTTCTCVVVRDGELRLGHVGDTRAYLLREGELRRLTRDHSLVAAMVASGVLTAEEAEGHPDSNKVLRSLGSQRELPDQYVDGLEAAWGEPSLKLRAGDWLLVCSDGVWGQVKDAELRTVLSEALDCPTAARAIVERALAAGAPDNATAVVARCFAAATR